MTTRINIGGGWKISSKTMTSLTSWPVMFYYVKRLLQVNIGGVFVEVFAVRFFDDQFYYSKGRLGASDLLYRFKNTD